MAELTRRPSPAASATSPSAESTALNDKGTQLEGNKKRKPTKESEFQVVQVLENPRKKRYSLKAIKSFSSKIDVSAYPIVYLKEERADNKHAFQIMHGFHHRNILRMKLLAKNKLQSNDPLAAAAFVEPYDGMLLSICGASECADDIGHIPSPSFQRCLREIILGIDFLVKNNLYHGNLSWESTLHTGGIVKLAGFMLKESMNEKEAQWNDYLCFIKMLEEISERAHQLNQTAQLNASSSQSATYFCGSLDSLISMIKKLDCTSLLLMKDIILEDPFFWDFSKRVKFFANTISLKLDDKDFMKEVRNSTICEEDWDKNCTPEFKNLVTMMNDHRENEKIKIEKSRQHGGRRGGRGGARRGGPGRRGGRGGSASGRGTNYDGKSKEHYVRCICGGYTHHRQMEVNVDCIIRENHPTICIDMRQILDTADGLPSGTQSS